MHYLLIYDVVEDYVARRAQFRAAHLALGQQAIERGELLLGGALAEPVDGAVLLFCGESPAGAEAFAAKDPYVLNGLVTRWRVRPWTTVVGPGAGAGGPWSSPAQQRDDARPTAEILHDFPIRVPAARVYEEITSPAGLDRWWTARSAGEPRVGTEYRLWFGPEYDWRAMVTQSVPDRAFQLEMTVATPDWIGTRTGFVLEEGAAATTVRFYHTGWPDQSDHYRNSSFCWAMYLRVLKRHLEHGELVPYDQRLSV